MWKKYKNQSDKDDFMLIKDSHLGLLAISKILLLYHCHLFLSTSSLFTNQIVSFLNFMYSGNKNNEYQSILKSLNSNAIFFNFLILNKLSIFLNRNYRD